MDSLFISVLNMSLTGAFVIIIVCLARPVLRKSPRIFLYNLWAVAGFRLTFPFSIESAFSLIPFNAQPIPPDIAMHPIPPASGNLVASAMLSGDSAIQLWIAVGSSIWLVGSALMLLYGVASFVVLKRKLTQATNVEANIYETETIKTPFVMGIFSPKIYLPAHLNAQERNYIVLHEQTHIRRRDHIVKFVAFLILCLHWFNPLAWLAFLLMSLDMEMSCDERVLKELGNGAEIKKNYSMALLSLATERRALGGSSIAFIDGDIGSRVKNVLNLKKQSYIVFGVSMALVAVLSLGFSVDRVGIGAASYDAIPETVQSDSFSILCCD